MGGPLGWWWGAFAKGENGHPAGGGVLERVRQVEKVLPQLQNAQEKPLLSRSTFFGFVFFCFK